MGSENLAPFSPSLLQTPSSVWAAPKFYSGLSMGSGSQSSESPTSVHSSFHRTRYPNIRVPKSSSPGLVIEGSDTSSDSLLLSPTTMAGEAVGLSLKGDLLQDPSAEDHLHPGFARQTSHSSSHQLLTDLAVADLGMDRPKIAPVGAFVNEDVSPSSAPAPAASGPELDAPPPAAPEQSRELSLFLSNVPFIHCAGCCVHWKF